MRQRYLAPDMKAPEKYGWPQVKQEKSIDEIVKRTLRHRLLEDHVTHRIIRSFVLILRPVIGLLFPPTSIV
jgi:hypothetical protein